MRSLAPSFVPAARCASRRTFASGDARWHIVGRASPTAAASSGRVRRARVQIMTRLNTGFTFPRPRSPTWRFRSQMARPAAHRRGSVEAVLRVAARAPPRRNTVRVRAPSRRAAKRLRSRRRSRRRSDSSRASRGCRPSTARAVADPEEAAAAPAAVRLRRRDDHFRAAEGDAGGAQRYSLPPPPSARRRPTDRRSRWPNSRGRCGTSPTSTTSSE